MDESSSTSLASLRKDGSDSSLLPTRGKVRTVASSCQVRLRGEAAPESLT